MLSFELHCVIGDAPDGNPQPSSEALPTCPLESCLRFCFISVAVEHSLSDLLRPYDAILAPKADPRPEHAISPLDFPFFLRRRGAPFPLQHPQLPRKTLPHAPAHVASQKVTKRRQRSPSKEVPVLMGRDPPPRPLVLLRAL